MAPLTRQKLLRQHGEMLRARYLGSPLTPVASVDLRKAREDQTDDLMTMLEAWHAGTPACRDVALDIADRNRRAAERRTK